MRYTSLTAHCALLINSLIFLPTFAKPLAITPRITLPVYRNESFNLVGRDLTDNGPPIPDDIKAEIEDDINQITTQGRFLRNFDRNNADDAAHIAQLKDAISDANQLASYVSQSWDDIVSSGIYGHWFPDAYQSGVQEVIYNIWGGSDTMGSDQTRNHVYYTNKDWASDCTVPGTEKPDEGVRLAYTANDVTETGIEYSLIHVCPQGFDEPKLDDLMCGDLGYTLSEAMTFLGASIFHEYIHNDLIGQAAIGRHVTDIDEKGKVAYGPLCSSLPDEDKPVNADNYRWLALEYLWTLLCEHSFSGPRANDPDSDTPECAPGQCIND